MRSVRPAGLFANAFANARGLVPSSVGRGSGEVERVGGGASRRCHQCAWAGVFLRLRNRCPKPLARPLAERCLSFTGCGGHV